MLHIKYHVPFHEYNIYKHVILFFLFIEKYTFKEINKTKIIQPPPDNLMKKSHPPVSRRFPKFLPKKRGRPTSLIFSAEGDLRNWRYLERIGYDDRKRKKARREVKRDKVSSRLQRAKNVLIPSARTRISGHYSTLLRGFICNPRAYICVCWKCHLHSRAKIRDRVSAMNY